MSDNGNSNAPYLKVENGGREERFELDTNSNVLVGTGGHCKIQLEEGNDVKSLHCILKLNNDGEIEVRDWNTGCTIINGTAISEPSILRENDVLSVGNYQITPVLAATESSGTNDAEATNDGSREDLTQQEADSDFSEKEDSVAESGDSSRAEVPCESTATTNAEVDDESTAEVEGEIGEETSSSADSLYDDIPDSDDAEGAVSSSNHNAPKVDDLDKFVYDIDADFGDTTDVESFSFADSGFGESISQDDDEVQLLRMEVDQLRFELAQRDSIAQSDDLLDRQQTERLVLRLEELLSELKKSDVRTRELEELLRDSDQAANDEKEERKNIEKWIGELESRVNQREEEAESEIQQLKKQLTEARSLQQKTNERLQGIIEHKTGEEDSDSSEIVNQLKEQVRSLQEQLKTAHGENQKLERQLEESSELDPSQEAERLSDQKMAEMQLEMSRERAEISRQRVELKKLKADLELRLEAPKEVNTADTRIQAMREHLKELHDQEQEEKSRNREAGLTGRIANLLNRVTKK